MTRVCIYMTYNKENRIYEYMIQVLKSLRKRCTKVYLVCNYKEIRTGLEEVSPYVDNIFYRENTGYDAGAYKDALCDFIGWEEVNGYDELILANDSFFGFFYPLQDSFDLMDKKGCDFWGMTRAPAGIYDNPTYEYDTHIQSYFLVLKSSVFHCKTFMRFWDELAYPESYRAAIMHFEHGINKYLERQGFKGISYMDVYHIKLTYSRNPYLFYPYELVVKYKVPIMKKKALLIRNAGFVKALNVVDFLKTENRYPVSDFTPYLENQFYVPGIGEGICNSLEVFYNRYLRIYIYGAGVCGRNLAIYFGYKGWRYEGFIVTDKRTADVQVMNIDETDIDSDVGIIISVLDAKTAREIAEYIGNRCKKEQLFFISDCEAIQFLN